MTKVQWKRILWRLLLPLGGLLLVGYGLDKHLFPLPKQALSKPHAQFVYSREGYLLNCFTSSDRFWRRPVTFEEISLLLVKCVLACEDQWFYYHPGFNPVSLVSAAVANLRAGRVVRGGSTITMQIARMMEPKERTIKNKLIEILRATQLELHYSKDELLETYFNLVPYGGNIEGIGAASLFYFDKPPSGLSLSECATLSAIPVSPSNFRPDKDVVSCSRRRDRVLAYLLDKEVIFRDEYDAARHEEIPSHRCATTSAAPHFCQSLALAYPDSVDLISTIDFEIQSTCERLTRRHHARLTPKEIHNLSLVVLDNATGEVLALVGSPDFGDDKHNGQINGARAARSPGSALKPFIYALGFERGLISPQTRLADIPVNYAGYSPENYDEEYHGVVSAREALIQSYNIPAVNVTAKVGLEKYYHLLKNGGLSTLGRRYYEYGLPLALGACEVNLVELSNLYATLARGGWYRNVSELRAHPDGERRRLFSQGVCYLITEILSDLKRPDLPTSWEFTSDLPRIAWKTGTSYGRKDAWTIGYNPKYTIGVWAGNFSGEGSIDIVGAEIAAPVMFDIFNKICSEADGRWFQMPDGVDVRQVCAVSGKLPGEFCKETIYEQYLPGKSPTQRCDIHHMVMVDKKTGHRLCRYCSAGRDYDEVIVQQWPAKLAGWLEGAGRFDPIPPHNPECRGILLADGPVITSPEDEAVYVLQDGIRAAYQQILLQASAPSGCRQVHWFVDWQFYASCEPGGRVFYTPATGKHHVMCLGDQGYSQSISFEVK